MEALPDDVIIEILKGLDSRGMHRTLEAVEKRVRDSVLDVLGSSRDPKLRKMYLEIYKVHFRLIYDDDVSLHSAKRGHINVLKMLDRATLSVALVEACSTAGSSDTVRNLIDAGADANHDYGEGVYRAVGEGDVDTVRVLLEGGARIGRDLLPRACRLGHSDIVRLFIRAGVNKRDLDYSLGEAILAEHIDIARILLEAGADREIINIHLLSMAIEFERVEAVRFILGEGGVDVGTGNILMRAVEQAYLASDDPVRLDDVLQIIAMLLKAGADVTANDNEAIREAPRASSPELISMLIAAGADVTARGSEAYRVAIATSASRRILQLLVEAEKARESTG
jgi:ankyrin repeat protein